MKRNFRSIRLALKTKQNRFHHEVVNNKKKSISYTGDLKDVIYESKHMDLKNIIEEKIQFRKQF